MPTELIGLYAAGTGGSENAAASVDIPFDGSLTGVDWDIRADLDGDTESIEAELSFISTNQLSSNDVRGRISSCSNAISLTTSGVAPTGLQKFVGPVDIPVAGGERLHLHIVGSAGVSSVVRCTVHLDTRQGVTRRSARRR